MTYYKLAIDFEYFNTNEEKLTLVCCCLNSSRDGEKRFWLFNNEIDTKALISYLKTIQTSHVLISYGLTAEGGAIYSLDLDPLKFKGIDLYSEFRVLTNQNEDYVYGYQLTSDGKPCRVLKPKKANERTPITMRSYSLAAAVYKILNIQIDTDHKNFIRECILSGNETLINESKQAILDYCASDIKHLIPLYEHMTLALNKLFARSRLPLNVLNEMLGRGETALSLSLMERRGYPIELNWVKNFIKNVPILLEQIMNEINSICFNELKDNVFRQHPKTKEFTFNTKVLRLHFINNTSVELLEKWEKTDKGQISLSLDAVSDIFGNPRHEYDNSLGQQLVRYLKLKQSLAGFTPIKKGQKNRKTILQFTGKDERVRSFLGLFGSKTGRFQPTATSFIFLKSAWVRGLVHPKDGKVITSFDYSSEEFLLAALLSKDKNMIDAYHSGDPYLWFAIKADALPSNADKKDDHVKRIRNKFKSTVLGLQYGMGSKSLARKLTVDTGHIHDEYDAKELIELFKDIFHIYTEWQGKVLDLYNFRQRFLKIRQDGFPIFNNVYNERTVKNFPIQGTGAAIMRRAINMAHKKGLKPIFPLHDALYVECDLDNFVYSSNVLYQTMQNAFTSFFPEYPNQEAHIRLDGHAWGSNITSYIPEKELLNLPYSIHIQDIYIDDRSKAEYERYKKYFQKLDL